jgi:2-polyprenyl-3-methyl-5-hydroxy-6-metoxy-1,4-benzoquinol methylase
VGKAYRDRIYRHYVEAATTALAPDTIAGLAPRKPYLADLVARHFPPDRAARIVEIGCGHGALLHVAAEAGYTNMAGIDGSPSQVAAAQRLGINGVRLGEGHAALAEEKDASLDAVIVFDVLEHLDRDELIRMADETFRVLKSGGRWIIHVPNGMAPFAGASLYGDLTHELAFTPDSLAQLVYATGFTSLACYEDVPVAHGLKSAVRKVAWLGIRQLLRAYYAIETGTARGAVFTQNLLAVAVK